MISIEPQWPGLPPNVRALCTTRAGGVSGRPYDDGNGGGGLNLGAHVGDIPEDVARNREILRSALPAEPAWLTQVHGAGVVDAASAYASPVADASFATQKNAVCAIMTADCLPVLLCDNRGGVVGAAHAGWRGLAGEVLEASVAAMRDAGAGELSAWLGPAIGPDAFEVGGEVLETFAAANAEARRAFRPHPELEGKYFADIYLLARQRLAMLGVAQVWGGEFCTVSERRFYSFRRDKTTGRMASLIWLA